MVEKCLWIPSTERIKHSHMNRFLTYIRKEINKPTMTYADLYKWSVSETEAFWSCLATFVGITWQTPPSKAWVAPKQGAMLGGTWFAGAELNYAENLLCGIDDRIALIRGFVEGAEHESTYSGLALWNHVAAAAASLKSLGLAPGDRVAAIAANTAETMIAMLAVTSLGGVWCSCSPDFGIDGILDRFSQIAPKVLFFTSDYAYQGKRFFPARTVEQSLGSLPTIEAAIALPVPFRDQTIVPTALSWAEFLTLGGVDSASPVRQSLFFAKLGFNHPLYIMFSSGTTGVPKCIVHGVGGTLLQHKKELLLHSDIGSGDRLLFFTTCGWMMWNWMVTALSTGATLALYEGSVSYPDSLALWRYVAKTGVSVLGTSPKFLSFAMKESVTPAEACDLSALKTVLSTGSPLLPEHYQWFYRQFGDVHLASMSGGTDIISCFMLGNPVLPVYSGQIQGPGLGMAIESWDEHAKPVFDQKGELVCVKPFVSMPLGFWNDEDGSKYKDAYFNYYEPREVWRHGDFVEFDRETGGVIVYGRSDATLNPGGVRIGTAEIYRRVEAFDAVVDSIVVGLACKDDVEVALFIKLKSGLQLSADLIGQIKAKIRQELTPRHVPAFLSQVSDIPYTKSGKKVELAVANAIHGQAIKNLGALANPESLDEYVKWGEKHRKT